MRCKVYNDIFAAYDQDYNIYYNLSLYPDKHDYNIDTITPEERIEIINSDEHAKYLAALDAVENISLLDSFTIKGKFYHRTARGCFNCVFSKKNWEGEEVNYCALLEKTNKPNPDFSVYCGYEEK